MDFWWELSAQLVNGHLLPVLSRRLCMHGEKKSMNSSVSLFTRTPILLGQVSTLTTSFNLIYFHEGPSPNIVTLGVRASVYEFGGPKQSVHNKHLLYTSNIIHKILATMELTFLRGWGRVYTCVRTCRLLWGIS